MRIFISFVFDEKLFYWIYNTANYHKVASLDIMQFVQTCGKSYTYIYMIISILLSCQIPYRKLQCIKLHTAVENLILLAIIDGVTSLFLSWSHQQEDSFDCPFHTLTKCPTEFHIVEDLYRVDGFRENKRPFSIQLDEVKDRVKNAQWLIYR